MASHNVHANPKGVFFKLGMLAESQVLLAGPSNAGLADPGHGAALSLSRVTAALVGLQQPPTLDNLDNNVALLMMVQLGDVKRSSGRLIFYEKTVVSTTTATARVSNEIIALRTSRTVTPRIAAAVRWTFGEGHTVPSATI